MKQNPKIQVELLSPARDAETGMEAILHGADAVYIGAPKFGARAAATNSLDDLQSLVDFAHIYGARIYVTLNTLLRDDELKEAEQLVTSLYRMGVDALIVQDMALLRMNLPPIPLHASTQMDNRTPEQVKYLADEGFEQVVLARELDLKTIAQIHRTTPVALEAFVHGALCVSYSGQCYASQYCFNRSANRGECAQFCRLAFDLRDAEGHTIERDKHLLSLRDMNRSDSLADMLAAGITSFKIEGRLKNTSYVKNVTAYYRRRLDAVLKEHPEYERASYGDTTLQFTPQLNKSFNRGFTDYFLHERTGDVASFDTPKSLGEPVGLVKEIKGNSFTVAGVAQFANGDGLCFVDDKGKLQGMRINRAENNRLFPQEMPQIAPRTPLYRNHDAAFERMLSHPTAQRKISIDIRLSENAYGFSLEATTTAGHCVTIGMEHAKEEARSAQTDNIVRQLSKTGNSPFVVREVKVECSREWFIPSSVLSEWRRQLIEALLREIRISYPRHLRKMNQTTTAFPFTEEKQQSAHDGHTAVNYRANVLNSAAADYYRAHGVDRIEPAFERTTPHDAVLMTCRHCIRYTLGLCPKETHRKSPYPEPWHLVSSDGKQFRLQFDCARCEMKVLPDETNQQQ